MADDTNSRLITSDLDSEFARTRTAKRGGLPQKRGAIPARHDKRLPKIKKEAVALSHYAQHMMQKQANMASLTGTAQGANVAMSSPEIRNPLLNLINFYLPYDRKTLNQWIRYYDRFQPYIGNCLDIHGEFPVSDFHFTKVDDPAVIDTFEGVKENAAIVQYLYEASREYELLGECYAFWKWDDEKKLPLDYTIINPDLLDIMTINWGSGKKIGYYYEPEQELQELIRNQDAAVASMMEELDPVVQEALQSGAKIPLDPFNVMAMVRKASPYDSRGTSIVMRCLKELMYEDKLREAQYAIADQQITPAQIWKLGDPANGYMPTEEELEDLRNLVLSSRHDTLFTIISHGALSLDLVGYTGKLLPVIPEFEWVAKRVMVALFTNEAMLTGEGPTYSNAIVALKVLQGRYQLKRDKFRENLRKKLWEPIAKAHGFYKSKPADANGRVRTSRRELMVPDMEWNFKLDLTDQATRMQYMMQLVDKTRIPMKVICEVLDLDYQTVGTMLKSEEGGVFDPVYQEARAKGKQDITGAAGAGGAPAGGDAGGDAAGGDDATPGEGDDADGEVPGAIGDAGDTPE